MTTEKRLALVTGANRGLGFETVRELAQNGLEVILSSRDATHGKEQAARLVNEGLPVHFFRLDVADPESITEIYNEIERRWGRLDVLVNNAGILIDSAASKIKHPSDIFKIDKDVFMQTLEVNTIGAYQLCEVFAPVMAKRGYGRIVNVSSTMGQLSGMAAGYPAYRISKAGMNVVTCIFAAQYRADNVLINSVCPGWVRTDMGGPNAIKSIEEGVQIIVWAATLPDGGPTGGFYSDKKSIPW